MRQLATFLVLWLGSVPVAPAMAAGPPQSASPSCGLAGFRGELSQIVLVQPDGAAQPDPCSLTRMAQAALNYLRGNPEPARKYECRFSLGPLGIPCCVPLIATNRYGFDPVSLGDTDCRMEWQDARLREMVGEPQPDPVELGVRQRVLGYLRDDHYAWINPVAYIGEPIDDEWIGMWTTAKILCTLLDEYQRTRDETWKKRARDVFRGLQRLAIWQDGKAYYWGIAPHKQGEWLKRGWCATHARNYPFIVEPCVRYYEVTGDAEGLRLARAFTEGFLSDVQPEMGPRRIDPATGAFQDHVHLHTHAVWGVAHLGALVREPRYLDWAERAYRFVLAQGTDYGWYPEFIPQPEYRTEICVVGDMVGIAAWLARGGRPEYWDHIDRTVRNELRAAQFALTPAFVALFRQLHADAPASQVDAALAELRRLEGGFVAQATFDDWVGYPGHPRLGAPGLNNNGIQMMGCCPPEGMRGLWEAWQGTVVDAGAEVFVNLPLSRTHPAATVQAYRPRDGRLHVTPRRPARFLLRPPAWADRDRVALAVGGRSAPVTWGGPANAYVVVADASSGQTLTLRWPVPRFTQAFTAQSVPGRNQRVTVRWVGNQVVGVEPRGKYLPMFTGEP